MAKSYLLKVVTPFQNVFSEEIESLVAPGEKGYFGILLGHTPFVTTLKTGYLKIEKDNQTSYLAISEGFAEVLSQSVTILAETAEAASEIDTERAEKAKERADNRIGEGQKSWDVERAQISFARALNRLKVAEYVSVK